MLLALLAQGTVAGCSSATAERSEADQATTHLPSTIPVSVKDRREATRALRGQLLVAGRAGLAELAKSADAMLAVHALWEWEKSQPGPKVGLRDAFRQRLGIEPPLWWQRLLAGVIVTETCHYLPGVDSSLLS